MNHKQLLYHLSAEPVVQAMEYDVAKLTNRGMLSPSPVLHETLQNKVVTQFFRRWNCAFNASNEEVTERFREIARVAAAVMLHKYGFHEKKCTERALAAIDNLNHQVVLSDYFFRHADQAKSLIESAPIPLKRRPAVPTAVTFWREGDIVSYLLDGRYYAIYVHEIERGNTAPIVEFFDIRLDRPPTASDVIGANARGAPYYKGGRRVKKYAAYGMRGNPDLANQFKMIQAGWDTPPLQAHLMPDKGYTLTDIFELADCIEYDFSN